MFAHEHRMSLAIALLGAVGGCGDRTVSAVDLLEPHRIAMAQKVVCYLRDDGAVRCAGLAVDSLGRPSELDQGRAIYLQGDVVDLGSLAALEIIGDGRRFCALLEDGALRCWGENDDGQLGVGHNRSIGGSEGDMGDALAAVDLGSDFRLSRYSVGSGHACAVSTDGRVKCWGRGNWGQLGLGDTANRGDEPGEMGDALPYVELGDGVRIRDVSAGVTSTCALTTDGRVKCWGHNGWGQLGLGDTIHRGASPRTMGDALGFVDLGDEAAIQVSVGSSYACALMDQGGLKCWGRAASYPEDSIDCNDHMPCDGPPDDGGRLGLGDFEHRGDEPDEMGSALPHVELDVSGEIARVRAGSTHTCILTTTGEVSCFGDAGDGRLGLGDLEDRGDEPGEMGRSLPPVPLPGPALALDVHVGTSCAAFDDGVRCWGLVFNFSDDSVGGLRLGDEPGELEGLPTVPGL